MDIVDRLEYASMSTPEIALLREAAQYIRKLREELESDGAIIVTDSEGNEIATIEGWQADLVRQAALSEFITKSVLELAHERQEH
jgi:hypothetical protein